MENKTREKLAGQEALETFVKIKIIMLDALSGLKGLTDTKIAQFTLGKTPYGVNAIVDYADGKSSEEILGTMFGTVIDAFSAKNLRKFIKFKPTTTLSQYLDNLGLGAVVLIFENFTDFDAADYFKKAFPAARQFAQTLYNDVINGEGTYARQIWEGLKDTADIDLIVNYYSKATFKQWFDDFKELFDPSYTPPSISQPMYTVCMPDECHISVKHKQPKEIEKTIIKEIAKHDEITKLTLNNQTYNIVKETNLSLKDNIDNIPPVSLLLSNILIKKGEALDTGERELYIIKQGDTFSKIAEVKALTIQELLKMNTWLIDEGRVVFNQNKILVEIDNTNKNRPDSIRSNEAKRSLADYFNAKTILLEEQITIKEKSKSLER